MDNLTQNLFNKSLNSINKYIKQKGKIFNSKKKFKNPIATYASLRYNENTEGYSETELQSWVLEKFTKHQSVKPIIIKKEFKARYTDYKTFLSSKYWQKVKLLVLKRDGNKCTKCNSKTDLLPHHLTYKNHFNELNHLEDLITLCSHCHKSEHHINEKQEIENHFNSI
jgi:5-methylcytosine-specific restriction endonuclease McrA